MSKSSETVFFVMLTTQKGMPTPMLNDKDELALYGTEEAAEKDAIENILGMNFGYIVYEW